jgi:hypothetical protein
MLSVILSSGWKLRDVQDQSLGAVLIFVLKQKNHWRYLIAALGWLILGAQQPQPPKEGAMPDPRVAEALLNISAVMERQNASSARSLEKEPCKGIEEDKKSDLCAQWTAANAAASSARWAKYATYVGVGSLILSLAGLLALIKTLRQTDNSLKLAQKERASASRRAVAASLDTRSALEIAERNADAAIQAASLARDALQVDRAWLCVDSHVSGPWIETAEDGSSQPVGVAFVMAWKNYGNTPAKYVHVASEFKIFSGQEFPTFEEKFAGFDPVDGAMSGPGNIKETGLMLIMDDDAKAFREGKCNVALYSEAVYKDIFSNEVRRSRYCAYALHRGGTHTDRGGQTTEAIVFTPYGNNTAT